MRDDSLTGGESMGPVAESAWYMAGRARDSPRLGAGAALYLAFLTLLALFSISHGLGSAALNVRNLAAGGMMPGDPSVGVYLSNVAVHSLRAGLGLVLLALVALVIRRPSNWGRHALQALVVSVVVVVFDAIAVASIAIHSTTYGSDPLLEWSANYAFAPWLMVSGLLAVLFGHREMQRTAGAPGPSGASPVWTPPG